MKNKDIIGNLFNELYDNKGDKLVTYGKLLKVTDRQLKVLIALNMASYGHIMTAITYIESNKCKIYRYKRHRIYCIGPFIISLNRWVCSCPVYTCKIQDELDILNEHRESEPKSKSKTRMMAESKSRRQAGSRIGTGMRNENIKIIKTKHSDNKHVQKTVQKNSERDNECLRYEQKWNRACEHLLAAYIIEKQFPIVSYEGVVEENVSIDQLINLTLHGPTVRSPWKSTFPRTNELS
ncbi:hypothetical protein DASB73_018320 [Starmerella bacillaris]|uniref:SWIM-type domain-containing protein n=1 Tax=Starmerella bacillaris TaxID=1247836 RepID=A0AAV5RH15_STABA|nr:hypothetical protein DASB73_018320 [Starmerella bacillaris]